MTRMLKTVGSAPRARDALSRSTVIALTAGMGLLLTGCDQARVSEFSAQRIGDSLRLVSCEEVAMNGLTITVGDRPGLANRDVWTVDGEHEVVPGDQLVVFEPISGMLETERYAENLEDWTSLTLYVFGSPDGVSIYDFANVADGVWVRWDGTTGEQPCP